MIGWAIERRWAELISPVLVNAIHEVDTFRWRSALLSRETRKDAVPFFEELRSVRYDVAIDVQGAWKSAFIAQLSGAATRIGFSHPREYAASIFYTHQVDPRAAHVIEKNLELVSSLVGPEPAQAKSEPERGTAENGIDRGAMNNLLPTDPAAELWAERTLSEKQLVRGQFAMINPGAGWGAKCWPGENYAAVARGLFDMGLRSAINFGPAEEQLASQVVSASAGSAVAITCSVAQLTSLTRRARVFLGGDTGPMHLAAALRVPVVGIFGPTDPARNGPFGTESIVLRRTASVTNHSRRARADEAMLTITPSEVLDAARALLEKTATPQEVIRA
jgi:lipopolysaccharide heptosyltransferase I